MTDDDLRLTIREIVYKEVAARNAGGQKCECGKIIVDKEILLHVAMTIAAECGDFLIAIVTAQNSATLHLPSTLERFGVEHIH